MQKATSTANYQYRYFGIFRYLLANLVVYQHYVASIAPASLMQSTETLKLGSIAVLIFFCLSGFIIAEAAETIYLNRAKAFLANRILRIMPPFFVALSITIIVEICLSHYVTVFSIQRVNEQLVAIPGSAFSIKNIFCNFLSIIPGFSEKHQDFSFLVYIWSVRSELIFYLFIALCVFIHKYLRKKNRNYVMAKILGAFFLPLSVLSMLWLRADNPRDTVSYIPYFAFGVSCFYALSKSRTAIFFATVSAAMIVIQFLDMQHGIAFLSGVERFLILISLTAFFVILSIKSLPNKCKTIDKVLGDLSYYLYLNHCIIGVMFLSFGLTHSYLFLTLAFACATLWSLVIKMALEPLLENARIRIRGQRL